MKTNQEIVAYLKDVNQAFIEGEHFISYCNGYGDGYIHALAREQLITEEQMIKLEEWNNKETNKWYAIAKKDAKRSLSDIQPTRDKFELILKDIASDKVEDIINKLIEATYTHTPLK